MIFQAQGTAGQDRGAEITWVLVRGQGTPPAWSDLRLLRGRRQGAWGSNPGRQNVRPTKTETGLLTSEFSIFAERLKVLRAL